ncbi:MAG TPA: hypothetical protein VJ831_12315 [Jatrophihabitantaceae bacterium]|nr:hypothetical protein [Jatrophihabitantaceae bacterium]
MNDIDARIRSALHAATERIDEQSLTPALPPTSEQSRTHHRTVRWLAPSLAAATVAAIAIVAVVLSSGTGGPQGAPIPPAHSGAVSTPAVPTSTPSPTEQQSLPTSTPTPTGSAGFCPFADGGCPAGSFHYEPLWPFTGYQQVLDWKAQPGSQPWHLDARETALNFVHGYLGFDDITEVRQVTGSDLDAHVSVAGASAPSVAAVLHLVRYGSTAEFPWEVVGTDDTDFSLEQPAYGSKVTSPITAGGHITGVDENIVVVVRNQSGAAVSKSTAAPAGGENTQWSRMITFDGSGVLTIIASTGGHLSQHERFAIQGVHT